MGDLQEQNKCEPTCVSAVWMSLLQHRHVALVHVFEHSVQCGVEKPRRPTAL